MTADSILSLVTATTALGLVLYHERRNEQFRQLTAKCFAVQGNAVIENIGRVAALEEHLGVEIEFEEGDEGADGLDPVISD